MNGYILYVVKMYAVNKEISHFTIESKKQELGVKNK